MSLKFTRINYADLKARQKENYNFQKLSSLLADYGYATVRLSDDWAGADFVAVHKDGAVLKIQLKSRLEFRKDYQGKDLYIAFRDKDDWYMVSHDEALQKFFDAKKIEDTDSWKYADGYSYSSLSNEILPLVVGYKIVDWVPQEP